MKPPSTKQDYPLEKCDSSSSYSFSHEVRPINHLPRSHGYIRLVVSLIAIHVFFLHCDNERGVWVSNIHRPADINESFLLISC
jgi:hypothetical protein